MIVYKHWRRTHVRLEISRANVGCKWREIHPCEWLSISTSRVLSSQRGIGGLKRGTTVQCPFCTAEALGLARAVFYIQLRLCKAMTHGTIQRSKNARPTWKWEGEEEGRTDEYHETKSNTIVGISDYWHKLPTVFWWVTIAYKHICRTYVRLEISGEIAGREWSKTHPCDWWSI